MRSRWRGPRDPDEAWRKIKEARHLNAKALPVARSVAAWRERRAAEIDQPVRFVLSDIAVVGIAQAAPASVEALGRIRARRQGHRQGVTRSPDPRGGRHAASHPTGSRRLPPHRVDAISARPWRSSRRGSTNSRTTRRSTRPCWPPGPTSRPWSGRRRRPAGHRVASRSRRAIRRLVEGDAALAFEDGAVVLEERSRRGDLTWADTAEVATIERLDVVERELTR
ncbi:MAG: HRDC domain-containing protein [Acidimicrobiales bacterium]